MQIHENHLIASVLLTFKGTKDNEYDQLNNFFQEQGVKVFSTNQHFNCFSTSKGIIFENSNPNILLQTEYPIVGEIKSPGRISSNDYYPAGEICFIGNGLSTNMEAIYSMFDLNAFGTRYVAVVKDAFDQNILRKDIRSIFSIIGKQRVLVLESILGKENLKRRLVDVYEISPSKGVFLVRNDFELGEFFQCIGYEVIPVHGERLEVINLGLSKLVSNNRDIVDQVNNLKQFEGSISFLDIPDLYSNVRILKRTTQSTDDHEINIKFTSLPFPTAMNPNVQTTNTVLMVPPTQFNYNIETATSNSFMNKIELSSDGIKHQALAEFSSLVLQLQKNGINVHVCINDTNGTPDSVYPNNWVSTHPGTEDNHMVLYPMQAHTRRLERSPVIIRRLSQKYKQMNITDYETLPNPLFLEGTGALVLDRVNKIAYMCTSPRAHIEVVQLWCQKLGYHFHNNGDTFDSNDKLIYHTNVMMSVGSNLAIVCLDSVKEENRKPLYESLKKTHQILEISKNQMHNFCANVLELQGSNGPILAMSTKAFSSFTKEQLDIIQQHVKIVHSDVSTIETVGGGGVRCCIAELF